MCDDLTPKQKGGIYSAIARQRRERFYISFNCSNSYLPDYVGKRAPYKRYCWPILFTSREQAMQAMRVLPIFLNANDMTKGRGRIKSACVEKVLLDP